MILASSLHELLESPRFPSGRVAVACGVFDGVHRGHQKILDSLLDAAARANATPVVMTFAPHPRSVFSDEGAPPPLSTRDQQLELFSHCGVEATVVVNFTQEVARMSPMDFFRAYFPVDDKGALAAICVGEGWRFGARGAGDTHLLRRLGEEYDFLVRTVVTCYWRGKPISSTRIRDKIQTGYLAAACRMLGRPYAVRASVIRGKGIGAEELNCPTANLRPNGLPLPPHGVYAVQAESDTNLSMDCRRAYYGIAYTGTAPTVDNTSEAEQRLECHLFNCEENLYGREMEVRFLEFIRSGRKFPDKEALARRIQQDIAGVKRLRGKREVSYKPDRRRDARRTIRSWKLRPPS